MNQCFILDGINSKDIGINGIHIVRLSGESDTMPIFGGQSIVQQETLNSDYPRFLYTKKNNLQFTLKFSLLNDSFVPKIEYELGKIFAKSKPVSFVIDEDESKMLYVVPMTNNVEIVRYNNLSGYFEVSFEATTPYWLTRIEDYLINLSLSNNGNFTMYNPTNIQNQQGNYNFTPKIQFRMRRTSGTFSFIITNNTTNEQIIIDNCVPNEVIELHGKYLHSSTGRNVFKDWNRKEFILKDPTNSFSVNYSCDVYSEPQYPIWGSMKE